MGFKRPWTTEADNYKTWEDAAAKWELCSKREEMRGNVEESIIYDYGSHRARTEARHIELKREGRRATLASTHIPGAEALEPVIHSSFPARRADPDAVLDEAYDIFYGDSDSDES